MNLAGTTQPVPEVHRNEVPTMPTTKEFTIRLEDRPGTLGKLCQALAEGGEESLTKLLLPAR